MSRISRYPNKITSETKSPNIMTEAQNKFTSIRGDTVWSMSVQGHVWSITVADMEC